MSRFSSNAELVNTSGRSRMKSLPPPKPSKRLILCEDGTWMNADNASVKDSTLLPTNITRISRAIKSMSSDDVPQVVYYHWGIGAGGSIIEKLMGISGNGLSEIVREGYQFLATNYVPGDEICIFGFSRGAYTARAIAGLIGDIGMLTKDGLPFLAEIFRDVQHKHDKHYQPRNPDIPFRDKPGFLNPAYTDQLVRRGLTTMGIPIKLVGVWDTVGSLGTPKIGWLTKLGLQSKQMKELSFYDTSLSNCIENAFQALALDEKRYSFQPTLWEKMEGNHTTLRQVWFPGAHANIGGGYADQQIATISLAWMMSQCQPFIDFDLDYIFDQWEECEEYYEKHEKKVRPWSFGRIWDGMAGIFALGGTKIRTPGRYCAVDPATGEPTHEPLIDTYEYIHPCVRARFKLGGPSFNDKGRYQCKALDDWKLHIEDGGSKRPDIFWTSRMQTEEGFAKFLPEAPLKPLEIEMLSYDKEMRDYVLRPSGVRQRKSAKGKSARSKSRRPD